MTNLVAFLLAIALLTITPGLDTALVLRAAVSSGRRGGLLALAGIQLGCLTWGGAVALGLGTLLAASAAAFASLKICGALYLGWMGLGLLWRPRQALAVDTTGTRVPGSDTAWLRRGFLTNILNPKVGVFYVSFLPPFVPQGFPIGPTVMGLVGLHVVMNIVWQTILVVGTGRLRPQLSKPVVVALLDRLTGLVFIGFGVKLALDPR